MNQMLASPSDCCRPCPEPLVTNIPGVPGQNGTNGANGAAGQSAWTATTADFVMPAEGGSVTVQVVFNDFIVIGEIIAVGDQGSATFGYFRATNKPNATSVDLTNLKNTASSLYLSNSAVGTTFPAGSVVGAGGLQGPTGAAAAGAAPNTAKFLTQTVTPAGALPNEQAIGPLATGLMKVTNGTGVVSSVAIGIANTNVAPVDQVAGMTAGQAAFATASGIESKTAANARTALGLVIGTANTEIAPVNDGGGLTNGEILRATATGIESVTNATIQAQLGVGVLATVTKTASYPATTSDGLILCDASLGNIIIDLPAAASSTGHVFIVKKIDATANTVTIRGHLAELIDASNTQVISSQWTSVSLVSNGTTSYII